MPGPAPRPSTAPYSVNGQNQYIAAGLANFLYDANGNLTSDGSTTFVYDVENRLVSASGARNAALVYDPLGRLFQTSVGATGVTRFLYDGGLLGEGASYLAICGIGLAARTVQAWMSVRAARAMTESKVFNYLLSPAQGTAPPRQLGSIEPLGFPRRIAQLWPARLSSILVRLRFKKLRSMGRYTPRLHR